MAQGRMWVADVALVCLAVVVVAFAGWLLTRDLDPTRAGAVDDRPPSSPSLQASTGSETGGSGDTAPTELRVLVLGDESVRGARSAGRWIADVDGVVEIDNRSRPLSGYVTDGPVPECELPSCPSLTTMLAQVVRGGEAPDVVLVSAGVHDVTTEGAVLRQGVFSFFGSLRAAFPDARIVVLAPVVRLAPAPTGLEAVTSVVAAVAALVQAEVVHVGQPYLEADEPTDRARLTQAGEVLRAAVDQALSS